MSLLRYWNIGCAVCIGLPLLILIVNRLFVRFGGEGGGGEADWGWGEDPEDRGVTTLFAYLWAMLLFLVLAFYGNAVLSGHNDNGAKWYKPFHDDSHPSATRNLGILTGATLVFANLAFVLFLVLGASSVDWDRPQGEGFWESSMFVPLTFLLWTLFGAVFGVLLYRSPNRLETTDRTASERRGSNQQNDTSGSSFLMCGRDTTTTSKSSLV